MILPFSTPASIPGALAAFSSLLVRSSYSTSLSTIHLHCLQNTSCKFIVLQWKLSSGNCAPFLAWFCLELYWTGKGIPGTLSNWDEVILSAGVIWKITEQHTTRENKTAVGVHTVFAFDTDRKSLSTILASLRLWESELTKNSNRLRAKIFFPSALFRSTRKLLYACHHSYKHFHQTDRNRREEGY